MNFSIIISIVSIIAGLSSVILSFTNFISTIKEMQIKIKLANSDTKINKTELNDLDKLINVPLTEVCVSIASYFEKISPNNEIIVRIYKIIDKKRIKIVSSKPQLKDNKYTIEENNKFIKVKRTKEPLIINNISYFLKHKNIFFNSNTNWNKDYQSTICYPIKDQNDIIVGFLSIDIMKPLNDLIDSRNITDFLKQQCKIIYTNREFENMIF